VLLRLKEDYDGAEPAASSIGVLNLLTLAHLSPELNAQSPTPNAQSPEPRSQVELTLGSFSGRAAQSGRTVPMMLAALSTYHTGMPQVVIAGDPASPDTRALIDVVRRRYMPTAIIVPVDPARREALDRRFPWMASMKEREGRATAYVCRDFACEAPTTKPEELDGKLKGM
jgi:uncharacterized protein YyaL (SSP411 family)